MRAILAAIDFSDVTERVVAEAATLARSLVGKVVLLTVLVEPVYLSQYAPPSKSVVKITVSQERAVRRRLAELQRDLQSDFVSAEIVVRRGNAAIHILEEAAEHDAAFIVIGSHGHSALFELVLGSTTQAVLKRAQQPVVVVPSQLRKPSMARKRVARKVAAN